MSKTAWIRTMMDAPQRPRPAWRALWGALLAAAATSAVAQGQSAGQPQVRLELRTFQPYLAPDPTAAAPASRRLVLTQEVFEQQRWLLAATLARLAPSPAGRPVLYGIVYAPYASEEVFRNEARLVRGVLEQRFAARGRVVQLVNHPALAHNTPWATPANLRAAINAIAARMDQGKDVLLLYATSHGGNDAALASQHWPLSVPPLTASALAGMLREAGIRTRVLIISACYSGSWMPALRSEDAVVLTAADAHHTSYGCGHLSELTYFGRALWDEQLRRTTSFEDAFRNAVPVIRQREQDAGKDDGFSNPQIHAGQRARQHLQRLQAALGQATPAPLPPPATGRGLHDARHAPAGGKHAAGAWAAALAHAAKAAMRAAPR